MPSPLSVIKKLPVFIFFYFSFFAAQAQVYNTSVSSATGGTGRAAVQAGDGIYLNSATLVHLQGRQFYSSFADKEFMVSLSDNTADSVIPAALSYIQQETELTGGQIYKQHDISLAFADFVVGQLTVGLTGHYFEQRLVDTPYRQFNGDLGFAYNPTQSLGLGLVVYNVFGEKNDVPEALRKKTSVGAGFNYIFQELARFRVDATSESIYMTGFESYLNRWSIFRFGYSNDTKQKRELATVGAGFDGPRFGLNYAYQGNTKVSSDYRHSVDLQIPF